MIRAIDPVKDVDGLHPVNVGQLVLGRPTLVPCDAARRDAPARASTRSRSPAPARSSIGRSDIVGKPMALLLLQANATVTICHSRTARPRRASRAEADILVVAIGRPGVVTPDDREAGRDGDRRRHEPHATTGVVGDVDPGAAERAGV